MRLGKGGGAAAALMRNRFTFGSSHPSRRHSTEPPQILIDMVEQWKLVVKSVEGFYRYPAEKIEERIRERDDEFLQKLKCPYLKDTKEKT